MDGMSVRIVVVSLHGIPEESDEKLLEDMKSSEKHSLSVTPHLLVISGEVICNAHQAYDSGECELQTIGTVSQQHVWRYF